MELDKIKSQLLAELLNKSTDILVSTWIIDRIPLIFENNLEAFVEWRQILASRIEVDPSCIIVTGSSSLGFSLNPYKNFRLFDAESDIDIAIVSDHHFTLAWRTLRQLGSNIHQYEPKIKQSIKSHAENYVYWGTIATDRILPILPFGKTWQQGLDHMRTKTPTLGRSIKARIYRDLESLRSYQAKNLKTLQDKLLNPSLNV